MMTRGIAKLGIGRKGIVRSGTALKGIGDQANAGGTPPPPVYEPINIFGNNLIWAVDGRYGINGGSPVDNDPVQTWADQTPNAANFNQATLASRPTYKTNQLNGQPGLIFDGVDDYIFNSTLLNTSDMFNYVVFRYDGFTPNGRILSASNATDFDFNSNATYTVYNPGNKAGFYRNGDKVDRPIVAGNSYFLFWGTQSADVFPAKMSLNDTTFVANVDGAAGTNYNITTHVLGAYLVGTFPAGMSQYTVYAAGVVNAWPTNQQISDLRAYIGATWGL